MEVSKELLDGMNRAYQQLEEKNARLCRELSCLGFQISSGWYGGHFMKDGQGRYQEAFYPIRVIHVEGCCDVELCFDGGSVTTRMAREAALEYPFERLADHPFEAYGVEDYLSDYRREGESLQALRDNLLKSGEREIAFAFLFPFDGEGVPELVCLLRGEGFYG